jgi:hypothetical protein
MNQDKLLRFMGFMMNACVSMAVLMFGATVLKSLITYH